MTDASSNSFDSSDAVSVASVLALSSPLLRSNSEAESDDSDLGSNAESSCEMRKEWNEGEKEWE